MTQRPTQQNGQEQQEDIRATRRIYIAADGSNEDAEDGALRFREIILFLFLDFRGGESGLDLNYSETDEASLEEEHAG